MPENPLAIRRVPVVLRPARNWRRRGDAIQLIVRKRSALARQHIAIQIITRTRLRIPLKAISHSGGKPIRIPEGNRSGVGAKRRWLFDVAKTDRNRRAEIFSGAKRRKNSRCEDGGAGQGAAV